MITVLVFLITEIDGSVTSTYLVTVPMMLPLYKKLKIDPKVLLFLCSATMCALFVLSLERPQLCVQPPCWRALIRPTTTSSPRCCP
ncbi:MAG: hypothetical protein ACLU9S_03750 [Oscillospiraceae bacterium]